MISWLFRKRRGMVIIDDFTQSWFSICSYNILVKKAAMFRLDQAQKEVKKISNYTLRLLHHRSDKLIFYTTVWFVLCKVSSGKSQGIGTGVAVRQWPHQYFNKKGACLLIFLLFTKSRGPNRAFWKIFRILHTSLVLRLLFQSDLWEK